MSDAVPPINTDEGSSDGVSHSPGDGPVPYVPQPAPVGGRSPAPRNHPGGPGPSQAFNPRLVVHPDGLSRHEARQAQVPAPYPAHPGWAGQVDEPPEKTSLLDRLMPKKEGAVAAKSSGPIKPFIAGFLFGVSFVLIVGYGWNEPEPVGPAWTLPSAPVSDLEVQDSVAGTGDRSGEW